MKKLMIGGALCLALFACNANDYATPDQKAELTKLDEKIESKEAEEDAVAKALEAEIASLKEKFEATLAANASELEAAQSDLAAKQAEVEGLIAASKQIAEERNDLVQEQNELSDEIVQPTQDALLQVGGMALSGTGLAQAAGILTLVGQFVRKRGRRHLKRAVKSALKLKGGETIAAVGNYLGYGSGSPDDALESAVAAAELSGDMQLAAILENALQRRRMASNSQGVTGIPPMPPSQPVPGAPGTPVPPPEHTPGPKAVEPDDHNGPD